MKNIDGDTCTLCNCQVVRDAKDAEFEDEMCLRAGDDCEKPEAEHVNWRASCLHATECAQKAERERDEARALCNDSAEVWRNKIRGAVELLIEISTGGHVTHTDVARIDALAKEFGCE